MNKRICIALLALTTVMSLCACSSSNDDLQLSYKTNESVEKNNSMITVDTPKAAPSGNSLAIPTGINETPNEKITAGASLIIDITDKKVLYEDNAYTRMYPASITKLMTALCVLQSGTINDTVTFSQNAAALNQSGAKKCNFSAGDQIKMKDLLAALLIYSGNDAAIAIADHVSGSEAEFVTLMNKTAMSIGATHSNFANPHGLHDENHYSSAYDLYIIFNECLKYQIFKDIVASDKVTAEYVDSKGNEASKTFKTTNLFMNKTYPIRVEGVSVLGGKTGTTDAAGKCLILYTESSITKHQYVSVMLHAESYDNLYGHTNLLLEYINTPS